MIYSVEITPEAEEDIDDIFRYIAYELRNEQAAYRQVNAIYDDIESLDEMPYRYALWRNEPWKSRGVRSMEVDNYRVFYLIEDVLARVVVLRVFYAGRNV